MCGISGFIAKKGKLIADDVILRLLEPIRHRGPDDEGYLLKREGDRLDIFGGKDTPANVWSTHTEFRPNSDIRESLMKSPFALGHRRLSILDLSPTGHQPMSYSNGNFWIVFNGEIYNYKQIRTDLEKLGHSFRTKTDTETILAAYSEWGDQCNHRFVGMWAFAIYDRRTNEIFLSRDRYGIKPLYYYFSPEGDLYFGSEIKQFASLNCWQANMNPNRVYDQLVYSFADHTDETMFRGVFQLPGGTLFKNSIYDIKPNATGKLDYKKWYSLKRDPSKFSFKEAVSNFRYLFERSVKEHLHADVMVGTALSGGLDSSSIVCQVNRILNGIDQNTLQKTFSSVTVHDKYSEKKWMDQVIKFTKVDAYFSYSELNDVLNLTSKIVWFQDEPYQSQSPLLAFNVFKLASDNGVKVLLNGQGADEYLGGYSQFTFSRYIGMLRTLKLFNLWNDIKESKKNNPISSSFILFGILFNSLPIRIRRKFTQIKSNSDHIKKIINNGILQANMIHPFDIIPIKYRTVQEISAHLTFFSTLPKYLHWEDRNSMAHSVEARVPFLDHRLVEFAYNLPEDFLEKDGITKRIMRESMNGLIPEKIQYRMDKMGFTTPEEQWVRNDNPSFFRAKITEAVSNTSGIIKNEALKYFDAMVAGKIPFDYTYWRIIQFSEWVKVFNINTR